jgi:hypothetical protein
VLLSLCYLVLRRVQQLVALRCRSNDYKELEIVVLRYELAILRRQTRRPALTTVDRLFFAAVSLVLPRRSGDPVMSHDWIDGRLQVSIAKNRSPRSVWSPSLSDVALFLPFSLHPSALSPRILAHVEQPYLCG